MRRVQPTLRERSMSRGQRNTKFHRPRRKRKLYCVPDVRNPPV